MKPSGSAVRRSGETGGNGGASAPTILRGGVGAAERLYRGREARRRGDLATAEAHFRAAASSDDPVTAASATYSLGRLLERSDDLAAAAAALRDSAAAAGRAGLPHWKRMAEHALARVLLRTDDAAGAEAILHETSREAAAAGDRFGSAMAARLRGEAAVRRGDPAAAETFLEEARALFEALDDRRFLSPLLCQLGEVRERRGRIAEATEAYAAALAAARRESKIVGVRQAGAAVARLCVRAATDREAAMDAAGAAALLDRAAAAAAAAGDTATAALASERARRLETDPALLLAASPASGDVGAAEAALVTGDYWSAVAGYQRALAVLPADVPDDARRPLRWRLGQAYHLLGHWYDRLYDLESAALCWRRRIEIAETVGDSDGLRHSCRRLEELESTQGGRAFSEAAFLHYDAGRRARAAGDLDTAVAALRRALETEGGSGGRSLLGSYLGFALFERGEAAVGRGDAAAARSSYRDALAAFAAAENDRGREIAERALAALPAEPPGDAEAPADALEEARREALAAETDDDPDRVRTAVDRYVDALHRKASAAAGRGDLDEAGGLLAGGLHLVGRLGGPAERRAVARAAAAVEADLGSAAATTGRSAAATGRFRGAARLAEASGDAPLIERARKDLDALAPRPAMRAVAPPDSSPEDAATLVALGEEARVSGDPERAVHLLEQAVAASGGGGAAARSLDIALHALGRARLDAGNVEGAIEAYRRRLSLLVDPRRPSGGAAVSLRYARVLLANLLVRRSRDRAAERQVAAADLFEALDLYDAADDEEGRRRAEAVLTRLGLAPSPRAPTTRRVAPTGQVVGVALALAAAAAVAVVHTAAVRRREERRETLHPVAAPPPEAAPLEVRLSIEEGAETRMKGYPARVAVRTDGFPRGATPIWRLDDRRAASIPGGGRDVAVFPIADPGRHRIALRAAMPDGEVREAGAVVVTVPDRIDVNAASAETLDRGLDGVGEILAARIVEKRGTGYVDLEDLRRRVPGLRRRAIESILGRCVFETPSP